MGRRAGRRGSVRTALILLSLLLPAASVGAEPDDATAVAARAAKVHERLCSDVAVARATKSFEASAEVSAVLADVSRTYDRTPELWLLYWRGLLAGCAEREERAVADLQAFVAAAADDDSLTAQVQEARRRRRLLSAGESTDARRPPTAGVAIGAGLLAGGGALAGLSGWQAAELSRHQAAFRDEALAWDERVAQHAVPGERAAAASNGLLVGAIGLGAGGAAAMAITAATGGKAPGVAVTPTDGGVFVALGGRW